MKQHKIKQSEQKNSALKSDLSKPSFLRRLLTGSGLGLLFFLVYGFTNYFTGLSPEVPSFYFGWETAIPFIPEMILPYMSLDMLFILAFMTCRTDRELFQLSWRIGFVIMLSALCFLLFPLKFAFAKPITEGWYQPLFSALEMDLPFNQAPSLHVSQGLIVWYQLVKGRSVFLRGLISCWFILIGLSTLLVYQHHLIDVVGGIAVGLMAYRIIPGFIEKPVRTRYHWRMALRYFAVAAVFPGLILLVRTMDSLSATGLVFVEGALFYVAVSYSLVALAYLLNHTNFTGKGANQKGQYPGWTWWLYAPYLLITCNTWKWFRSRYPAYTGLTPEIILGRRLHRTELDELNATGVVAIIDLTPDLKSPLLESSETIDQPHYMYEPVLDYTLPTHYQIQKCLDFIRQYASQGKVYIHCSLGYLRSAVVVGAWLREAGWTEEEIKELLEDRRPEVRIDFLQRFFIQNSEHSARV